MRGGAIHRLFTRVREYFFCDHQWRHLDTVPDQDVRSGYKFWSERWVCRKCGRIQTNELRNWTRN